MMLEKTIKTNLSNAPSNTLECVICKPFLQQINATPNLGFTLVELLVGIAVMGIMLVIAIPSYQTMIANSRMNAATDSLVSALTYARNTSLVQSVTVRVCPLSALNSTTCGGSWSAGWIVVTAPASGASTLLKSQQTIPTDPVITGSNGTVSFDSHGISSTPTNFKLCDSRGGTFASSVQVLATGYVQRGPTAGQAVWNNSALSCP